MKRMTLDEFIKSEPLETVLVELPGCEIGIVGYAYKNVISASRVDSDFIDLTEHLDAYFHDHPFIKAHQT